MASAEQEAKSQSEYQRGVSAWNFDIEDLKVKASLLLNDDEESMKSSFSYNCRDGFTMMIIVLLSSYLVYFDMDTPNQGKCFSLVPSTTPL